MPRNNVQIISLVKKNQKLEGQLKVSAGAVLRLLNKFEFGLEVYLAGLGRMRSLNKKYRGKNKAADVLSFSEPKGFIYSGNQKPLGEIFLNSGEFKDNKRAIFLLIHGVLHLLGYDHINKNDRIKMEKKEQEIIKCLPL